MYKPTPEQELADLRQELAMCQAALKKSEVEVDTWKLMYKTARDNALRLADILAMKR